MSTKNVDGNHTCFCDKIKSKEPVMHVILIFALLAALLNYCGFWITLFLCGIVWLIATSKPW